MQAGKLRIDIAPAFLPLIPNRRYKGAYGGRGSGKSYFFGTEVVKRCTLAPTRWICIREVQDTLKDSVHQLLVDRITENDFRGFDITDKAITHVNGSYIVFRGMQHYNATNIKSLQGFDGCWVEEAQDFSKASFDMLYPTLRKPGSELWFSWNPRYSTDPVDKFFRANLPDPDVIAVEANWKDNPWFSAESKKDMERDFRNDPDNAEHIWNGAYQTITEGAYYARLLLYADKDGRIAALPHNPALPVYTAWDLGVGDDTSIWFAQRSAGWIHIIDHYATNGQDAAHYLGVLRKKAAEQNYTYAKHILPHDANRVDGWVNKTNRLESLRVLGLKDIVLLPRVPDDDRINAARLLLPICRFDKDKCKSGLESLRQYRREYDENKRTFKPTPLHDWTSHDADAFSYLAMGLEPDAAVPPDIPKYSSRRKKGTEQGNGDAWMTA